MGAHLHRMLEVDPGSMTGVCAHCGPVRLKVKRNSRKRTLRYACRNAERRWKNNQGRDRRGRQGRYARFKKAACERCGFLPEHLCQLDVHHQDGDRSNDDEANLETLCANCHRLVGLKSQRYV